MMKTVIDVQTLEFGAHCAEPGYDWHEYIVTEARTGDVFLVVEQYDNQTLGVAYSHVRPATPQDVRRAGVTHILGPSLDDWYQDVRTDG